MECLLEQVTSGPRLEMQAVFDQKKIEKVEIPPASTMISQVLGVVCARWDFYNTKEKFLYPLFHFVFLVNGCQT